MENLQQIGLFDQPAPFQRSSDTSRAAAKAIQPKSKNLRKRVFDYIKKCERHGATNNEIAAATGMLVSTVCARRNELAKTYCIRNTGRRREGSSVWIAV
tara:strand:+ start:171 stop:467 length:297 start_codon:yes stop_codon:yes gene_type:complete